MPKLRYEVFDKEGLRSFDVEGGCLAVMGRYTENMQALRSKIKDGQPLTVLYKDLNNTDTGLEYMNVLVPLLRLPHMKCVLSSPEHILTRGSCAFNIHSFSYNQVMYCMFQLRTVLSNMVQPWGSSSIARYVKGEGHPAAKSIKWLMEEHDFTWLEAYTVSQAGYRLKRGEGCPGDFTSHGVADGNTYNYNLIGPEVWVQLFKGEYDLAFCKRKLSSKTLEKYTQNILKLVKGVEEVSMAEVLYECSECMVAKQSTKKDLFGQKFTTTDVDNLGECLSKMKSVLQKHLGDTTWSN